MLGTNILDSLVKQVSDQIKSEPDNPSLATLQEALILEKHGLTFKAAALYHLVEHPIATHRLQLIFINSTNPVPTMLAVTPPASIYPFSNQPLNRASPKTDQANTHTPITAEPKPTGDQNSSTQLMPIDLDVEIKSTLGISPKNKRKYLSHPTPANDEPSDHLNSDLPDSYCLVLGFIKDYMEKNPKCHLYNTEIVAQTGLGITQVRGALTYLETNNFFVKQHYKETQYALTEKGEAALVKYNAKNQPQTTPSSQSQPSLMAAPISWIDDTSKTESVEKLKNSKKRKKTSRVKFKTDPKLTILEYIKNHNQQDIRYKLFKGVIVSKTGLSLSLVSDTLEYFNEQDYFLEDTYKKREYVLSEKGKAALAEYHLAHSQSLQSLTEESESESEDSEADAPLAKIKPMMVNPPRVPVGALTPRHLGAKRIPFAPKKDPLELLIFIKTDTEKKGVCPSKERIMAKIGFTKHRVGCSLKELVRKNYIEIEETPGKRTPDKFNITAEGYEKIKKELNKNLSDTQKRLPKPIEEPSLLVAQPPLIFSASPKPTLVTQQNPAETVPSSSPQTRAPTLQSSPQMALRYVLNNK